MDRLPRPVDGLGTARTPAHPARHSHSRRNPPRSAPGGYRLREAPAGVTRVGNDLEWTAACAQPQSTTLGVRHG
jgi:hypothetical protein